MYLCPDCATEFKPSQDISCRKCGWAAEQIGEITNMLSSADRRDSLFKQYMDLYSTIAQSELEKPVNSDVYVLSMAQRTASMLRHLNDFQNKNVCDVGSGKGFLLHEIAKMHPKSITAIDIAAPYLQAINENANKIIANAENMPFYDEFDIVVSTDVMEHVLNVGSFMYGINKMLKMDGKFLVRVPYMENLLQYGRQFGSPYPFTHLRTYNLQLLKKQLRESGFEPIKILFDGFQPAYPRYLFRHGIGKIIFQFLVTRKYPDYWSTTKINPLLGRLLMKPIECNILCKKIIDL
jgi:predicted TPR repeat methyltransferase